MPFAEPEALPVRGGTRPRTTATPHAQRDQPGHPAARQRAIERALTKVSAVVAAPSLSAKPASLGLFLAPDAAGGPADAFLIGTEFAHFHPLPEGSLHVALPPGWRDAALARGWAEPHPSAGRPGVSARTVMLYAPRDGAEADVVARLVEAAWAYARG